MQQWHALRDYRDSAHDARITHLRHDGNAEAWPQEHPFRRDASTKCVESLAYVAGEDPDDSSPDLGSSRSSSTPLRSTAFTATMIEETDISSAENSGLSI